MPYASLECAEARAVDPGWRPKSDYPWTDIHVLRFGVYGKFWRSWVISRKVIIPHNYKR